MEKITLKTSPRDVFLYILAIVTLYISVWRFIAMIFEYIHYIFPDDLNIYFTQASDEIRGSMAALIVVFPVYLGITWFLRKDIIKNPEKRELWVRRWLLNLTLFLAAVTIIVDLIILVDNFLNGELTLRFVLKVLTVFIVASAVFGYYLWDLKRDTSPSSKPSKVLAAIVSSVILAGIVSGFFIVGSPATQRKMRFDDIRIGNLQSLQWEIVNFWQMKRRLPKTFSELKNDISGFIPPEDPETSASYGYRIKSALEFELCAKFSLPSPSLKDDAQAKLGHMPIYEPMGMYGQQQNWTHEEGEKCFTRKIDPDFYKPIK